MQVDGGDGLDHLEQAVGVVELLDFHLEGEFLQDLARTRRESGDVVVQVAGEVVRIGQQGAEGEFAGVVEAQAELAAERLFEHLLVELVVLLLQAPVLGQHLVLAGFQHAVQAAQHGQRNHHPAVLRRTVGTAQ
ncbi:MAG: hypothetical protein A2002_12210 [Pseudomonadales bacterium GWC1_66_9]|nr:MAG: hypothetical protein A2002_12210 [Pseudomonadales bacterium GWC1_66_9]